MPDLDNDIKANETTYKTRHFTTAEHIQIA